MNADVIIRKQQELIAALMDRDTNEEDTMRVTIPVTFASTDTDTDTDTPAPAAAPAPAFVFDTDTPDTGMPDLTAGPRFTIVTPEQTSITLTTPEPPASTAVPTDTGMVHGPAPAPAPAAQATGDDALVARATTVVTAGSRRKPLTPEQTAECIAAWARQRGTTFSKAQAVRECVGLNRVAVMKAIDTLHADGSLVSATRPGGKRERYQWA